MHRPLQPSFEFLSDWSTHHTRSLMAEVTNRTSRKQQRNHKHTSQVCLEKGGGLFHQSPVTNPHSGGSSESTLFGVGGRAESLNEITTATEGTCSRAVQDNVHTHSPSHRHHTRVTYKNASSGVHAHFHVAFDLLVTPFILNSNPFSFSFSCSFSFCFYFVFFLFSFFLFLFLPVGSSESDFFFGVNFVSISLDKTVFAKKKKTILGNRLGKDTFEASVSFSFFLCLFSFFLFRCFLFSFFLCFSFHLFFYSFFFFIVSSPFFSFVFLFLFF